jgi:DNA recombination protein RmuC
MNYLLIVIGIALGAVMAWAITWLFLKNKTVTAFASTNAKLDVANATIDVQNKDITQLKLEVKAKTEEFNQVNRQAAEFLADNRALNEKLETQKSEIEALRKQFNTEFENIANKILEEKTQKFTNLNEEKLIGILNPLKEKIQTFEKKVEDTYNNETREKASLKKELEVIIAANQRISDEANKLTQALKGDVKKQGNWGEIILERVLEASGLRKGEEYHREQVVEGVFGEVQRPDVIVYLPDNKHIVIDSKVSLTAYERMVDCEENKYEQLLKEHTLSLKKHVKELADKNYPNSAQLNAPDFVLMFMPIEASFSIAMQTDNELFTYAWEKKVVIVSPTTLLTSLKTIASVWKQESQTRNVLEIAKESGLLYDKFVAFTEDMLKVGKNMDDAKKIYSDAMNKLVESSRRGDTIVGRMERIRKLGANTSKSLNPKIVDRVLGNDESLFWESKDE